MRCDLSPVAHERNEDEEEIFGAGNYAGDDFMFGTGGSVECGGFVD